MNFTRYWKVQDPETWISLGLEGKGWFLESTCRIWNLNSFLSDSIIFVFISILYWALRVRAILLAFWNTSKNLSDPSLPDIDAALGTLQWTLEGWVVVFFLFPHPKDQAFSGGRLSSFIIFEEFHSISPHTALHLQGTSSSDFTKPSQNYIVDSCFHQAE